jgi:hypothetical protein
MIESAKLCNILIRPWFLRAKLVGRETEHLQPAGPVRLMEFFEACILGCKATAMISTLRAP